MCSIPGFPNVGCRVNLQITRVNVNPHTVLVEFGGNLNIGHEKSDVKEKLKNIELPPRREESFDGKPGDLCLVYENTIWHRARILSKVEREYKVFLIDDGKLLWASSNLLTKCPRNLCNLSPKVELCVLAGVSPLCPKGAWSLATSDFISSLSGKTISGCVQDVIMPPRIILLEIPSLAKQMHELGFATKMSCENFKSLVMFSLHSPRLCSIQKDLKIANDKEDHCSDPDKLNQYLYPVLSPGTIEIVTVTQVVHPLKIYCKLHVFSQELAKVNDQLHKHYEDTFPPQIPMQLSNGAPCATKGSNGKWYRSILQQNDITDVVKVFHVDYGIGDFVKLCNIRPLVARFFHLPVVTYACSLHGISDKGFGWRTEQIDYLKAIILDQVLVGKFEKYSISEGVYHVLLYGNENTNVNKAFGQREKCLLMTEKSCEDQTLETLKKVMNKKIQDGNESASPQFPAPSIEFASSHEDVSLVGLCRTEGQLQAGKREHMPNAVLTQSSDEPFIKIDEMSKVHVTCVHGVNQFYGHFAENAEAVRKVTKDIQQFCHKLQKTPQVEFPLVPEMLCLAKYSDGLWHRAKIESTHPNLVVWFVDYGDLMILNKQDIMELSPKASSIVNVPIQAVQFELFNLTLPEPCDLDEWFISYATDRLFTVNVKDHSTGKCTVEMYDDKVSVNLKIRDILSKSKRKKSSSNKASRFKPRSETSEGVKSRGLRSSFSTVPKEHNSLSNKVSNPFRQVHLEQNSQAFSYNTRATIKVQQQSPPYPKITDLPSKRLNKGHVSEIYVSHCNNPSSFYVQMTSDEDEIYSFIDQLNSSQTCDVDIDLNLLQSGDMVRAEYPEDGAWYRAVVKNKKDGLVHVEFIDFGNEATLLPFKIKQLDKKFLNTPRLSIHCTLECGRRGKKDWNKEEILAFKKAAGKNGDTKIQCCFVSKNTDCWFVSLKHKEGLLLSFIDKSGVEFESQICCDEDGQPLTLKDPAVTYGQTVEAYASSIVGPQYFWCQFSNTKELDRISLLAQEFGNSDQAKEIQPDQLHTGRVCLARFSDQLWYRAKVISLLDGKVSVLFVDYGNESEAVFNCVKLLPLELIEIPPQAFLCQLEMFGSVDGVWSCDSAADKFFELLVDEPLKVTIQSMVMSPDVSMCPQYSVLVECKGLLVNDLMKDCLTDPKPQTCGKLRPTEEKLETDKLAKVNKKDHIAVVQALPQAEDLPILVIEPEMVSEVYISHINNIGSFFLQLAEDERIFSVTEILNFTQPSNTDDMLGACLQKGSLVKAMFSEDNSWYRAVVKDIIGKDLFNVEFIDFGNEAAVPITKICKLGEQLLSYPRFSIHCSCSEDERFKILKETEQQLVLFKEMFGEACQKTLSCRFIKKDGILWEVKMTSSGDSTDSSIVKLDHLDLNVILLGSENVKNTPKPHFKKPDVSLGQTIEAFASCIVGPDYFWCQFSNSETLDHLSLISQECGNSTDTEPIILGNLNHGSPYLVRFLEDQMWYRAEVIKKSTATVSVVFVDFGNESEVTEGSVKAIPFDLLESPPQAFLCQLEGFNKLLGSWESEATEYFYKLIVDKPLKVTVQRTHNSVDLSSPSLHVTVESQKCLVNELMRKYWSASAQPAHDFATMSELHENPFEEASVDHLVSQDKSNSPSGSDSSKLDNLDPNTFLVVSKAVDETSQLFFKKPGVTLGQTVEVFATCIVGPDYFWCQFSNSETLDQITLIAQDYGNSIKTQPLFLDNLDNGSICLARFQDDQMWYRAEVIKKSVASVSVVFVDFGNESEVTEGSVKALPCDLMGSPPQAFLCRLEGFRQEIGSWDKEATDYFYEFIVDNPLKVTIEHTDDSMDPSCPPFYVNVEAQQCLVNEVMRKFWNTSASPCKESTQVSESPENKPISEDQIAAEVFEPYEAPGGSNEDNQPGYSPCPKEPTACPLLETDSHDNRVDDELGTDVFIASANPEVTDDDNDDEAMCSNSVLKVKEESHESELVLTVEEMLLDTAISTEGPDDERSLKVDIPLTPSRRSDWVARLENQMLPMVCSEDSCESVKGVSK